MSKSLFFLLLGVLFTVATLSSCGGGEDDTEVVVQAVLDKVIIEKFLADSSITATEDASGIYYQVITENPSGDTQGANGSILSIYYTAKVLNGDTFELVTLDEEDDPAKLKQGVNAVYPIGLDIGLGKMRAGEKYRFYIPSALGYGDFSFSSLIPTNSILSIEVELIDIQNETDLFTEEIALIDAYIVSESLNDTLAHPLASVEYISGSQIYYKRLSAGIKDAVLSGQDTALINYSAKNLNNDIVDENYNDAVFGYTFGSSEVISGLNVGLGEMEKGEEALLIIPSHLAYKESAFVIPNYLKQEFVAMEIIPQYTAKICPFEVLIFQTTLLSN